MPLHKSSRAPRLDPTMISAPLGDFRHTMHIGRGGDAFGDTSFLSSHGPASPASSSPVQAGHAAPVDSEPRANHVSPDDGGGDGYPSGGEPRPNELHHSESVSSFDLDLDLGPSILGDVLGVMDGLGLDSNWTTAKDEDAFGPVKTASGGESVENMWNDKQMEDVSREEMRERSEEKLNEANGVKSKGLRPKVRFSDKKDEIIGRQISEVEGEEEVCVSPTNGGQEHPEVGVPDDQPEPANHRADSSPSPASSVSSEYEGVSPLDRRREERRLSETDSEEEEGVVAEQGYTFEDEFDDEIGL